MTPRATLLIVNGRVWSDGRCDGSADAVAVAGGCVIAVGRSTELEPLAGEGTGRIDAAGATVTPGLVDAHLHLLAWARSRDEVVLGGAASRREALGRIADFLAANPGPGPISGRGWDANAWGEPPDRGSLDAVSGGRPVLLHSRDYHALWVNGAALRAAGVTRATPDPPGGRIERDAAGEPAGVVREHAVRLFAPQLAAAVHGSDDERLAAAVRWLHAQGVTEVHDFEDLEAIRLLRAYLRDPDRPRLRLTAHLPEAGLATALGQGLVSGAGDGVFRYGALKLFADGTLGSRTAALLEPYEGSEASGMDLMPPAELARSVTRAAAGGLAVAIHAIGDRAVRSALDAIEAAAAAGPRPMLPSRIEHAQLVDPADLPRFARLGVWASMQPAHCVSDIELAERGWGARVARSYPWRALLDAGATLAFGSDAPVEPPRPIAGIHAAVTRQRADGTPPGGFTPGQRIGLDEALRAYTTAGMSGPGPGPTFGGCPGGCPGGSPGQYLGRGGSGSIAPGAPADLVVWDADLHRLPASLLYNARPACTLLAGEIVHRELVAPWQDVLPPRRGT
jgi:predicted amidohydrolase YtcJ